MKAKRVRRFTITEETFGLTLVVQIGGSQSAALKHCSKQLDVENDSPDEGAFAWACCAGNWAYVWLEHYPTDTKNKNFGALVHELYHVVTDFLGHIESKDEETGAYLLQYLFRKVEDKLK